MNDKISFYVERRKMKKYIRWISLFIVLEVVLTLLMIWIFTYPLGSINSFLLIILVPILLICISFFIYFVLTFRSSYLSDSILIAVFEKNKISLIIYLVINIYLLFCSVYFFITADLLEPEIYSNLQPYAVLGYVLFWEIIILFSYTRKEFRGKPKYWIGLPFLLVSNYFLWHTLVKAGRYLQSFFDNVYPTEAQYVFSNYKWWQLLLPIKEFKNTWPFGLVITFFLENIIGPAGVWYLFQAILILTSFFLSWKVFRSEIFSYFLAICLGFSTHNYHAFQYSGVTGFYLLQALFLLLLYLAYEFIRREKHNYWYLSALIPTLMLTAIFYEGWLDFFASIWLMSIFLFFYFRRKKQTQYLRNLLIIFGIFNLVAFIYIYIKFSYIEFAHATGESAIVVFYSKHHIWRAVEDLISNYITHMYMTLTNFLPPAFVTSNSLYHYTEFLEQQDNLVIGHYIFLWRYFAGVLTALFYVFFINLVKRAFKENPFSSFFPFVVFMIMVAVNGATHTIIQFRPMKAMPVLGYYVQQGVLGFSLCLAYLFHLFKLRAKNKKIVVLVAIFVTLIILWSSIRRPNYLWHMIEMGGLDHQGPYPNPFIVLLNMIRRFFPRFLSK